MRSMSSMSSMSSRSKTARRAGAIALSVATVAGAAACSSSSSTASQQAASSKQAITFAISGLGAEGTYLEKQVKEFEAANPNINVVVNVDSSNSTVFLSQINNSFAAGASTPDLVESDVTYTAKWAAGGYLAPVSCSASDFNSAMWSTGTFQGKQYSCPFFLNTEGLWYRTDLIKTPPTTPQQVVTDAQAAMKADPKLKEGIAFEGDQYEGEITSFMVLDKAFGGSLNNLSNISTPQNVAALNYLHTLIYQDKLAPAGVTSYTEGQTGDDFDSGYAAFAINWPYVASGPFSNGVTASDIGYIPFPAASGGQPGVALGGSVLSINAKTAHIAAVNKLIAFLTTPAQQTARAIAVSDAPAVLAAYNSQLFANSALWKTVQGLAADAAARPVSPYYLTVSADLQEMISSAYASSSPSAVTKAFSSYATTVASDANPSGS
jgi:multiple sugar transport system substrate-binding protein